MPTESADDQRSYDRSQQSADAAGFNDRRMVLGNDRSEGAAKVRADIACGSTRRDGVAKHLAAPLLGSVGRLVLAAFLQASNDCE
jgi:hypothetical protein